jgi:hypothetical protein
MYMLLIVLAILAVIIIAPPRAHAYLDPGTGSYVVQILIATLLGGVVAFKSSLYKIRDIFTRKKKNGDSRKK